MPRVDEVFQKSSVPGKRKLDPIRDPNEVYRASKRTSSETNHHARVDEDKPTDIAGPASPGDEADYGPEPPPEDDEEGGRFFGGGISKHESEIFDFVDRADEGDAAETIDSSWLRKTAVNFERRINKNAELRAKFEDDPQKFIASEAELDGAIKSLSVLAENPHLYEEFVNLGCAESLVGLLAHDNTDIAIDAIEIIGELTDDDVVVDEHQWNILVKSFIKSDLVGLLVSNLTRLDEDDDSDRVGVYHSLGILENLQSQISRESHAGWNETLLTWLLERIQKSEASTSQNKQYAAEMVALLSRSSADARAKLTSLGAIDSLLQLAAAYRRRDPEKGGDEEEYAEDLFEALAYLVEEPEAKLKFVAAEGIELCLLMQKEGKMSKAPSLRLIEYATAGISAVSVCQRIVTAGGLKKLFSQFMKSKNNRSLSQLIKVFASMLQLLPADEPERIRLLAKFVEKDYEKVIKTVQLREYYTHQVKLAEQDNELERQAASPEKREELGLVWFGRRLDAGLSTLQVIDTILAWLIAEDGGARRTIKQLLGRRDESFADIKATLREQINNLDDGQEDGKHMSDMLGTLIEFL